MSNSKKTRNLPSWMSSRPKKTNDDDNAVSGPHNSSSSSSSSNLSKLMEGVVFVLSGFVNPERSTLRTQALEMGADFKQDWNSESTLLVCAFPNTPKFRQVQADQGTIVSKDWISECYTQKRLVEIEPYLMNVGKPWKITTSNQCSHDEKPSMPTKSQKLVLTGSPSNNKQAASAPSKSKTSYSIDELLPASRVKEWAIDDFKKTISWLQRQEEKPEPSEIKQVAAEGILTCLQDAIDLLDKRQGVEKLAENWGVLPHVVAELIKVDHDSTTFSKEDLCRKAKSCKKLYEEQLKKLDDESPTKNNAQKRDKKQKGKSKQTSTNPTEYDSDETIEMTVDEIDLAFKTVSSKF
ncbi:hypothetical protein ACFE04_008507 [Oxalis oulophora]